nr:lysine-sensitive aspartokinase 3 [Acidobacteriota bacterium]
MIVQKFGGTSLADAAAIARVTEIVRRALPRRPVVVVSAMAKTTRDLLESAAAATAGDSRAALALWEELWQFHH